MCRSSTLTILVNSGRLVHYYSLFWGPEEISTIEEPLGAFTCRSSTLAGFVDSDPFRGLFLTVLGSQRDFHFCRTTGCAYGSVISPRSFGRFWPVSWSITHDSGPFWVPQRFSRLTIPRVRLLVGHQQSQFWPILARFVDYYSCTVLGSWSDFHN